MNQVDSQRSDSVREIRSSQSARAIKSSQSERTLTPLYQARTLTRNQITDPQSEIYQVASKKMTEASWLFDREKDKKFLEVIKT